MTHLHHDTLLVPAARLFNDGHQMYMYRLRFAIRGDLTLDSATTFGQRVCSVAPL